ncbi:MAG: shikimate kinase [Cyclobacteriaceae bacterium]
MKIFFIGLPGCGKTTIGSKLAQSLKTSFVDLDHEIVKGEKQQVAVIFEKLGEQQFRVIEQKYLKNFCASQENFVMATGGGTPCFFDNLELINNSGVSIFLDTATNEIANRMMKTELAKRPMFANQNVATVAGRVAELRSQRIQFYNKAHIILSGDEINPEGIVQKVEELKRQSDGQ